MFFVFVCMDGILAPSILPHRTSLADAALAIYRTAIKLCVVCYFCVVIRCLSCCCFYFYFSIVDVVVPFFVVVVVAAPLVVRLCAMTYVIFVPLYVGLLWVLLYNHYGFLPSRLSGGFLSYWFSINFLFFIKKKKTWRTHLGKPEIWQLGFPFLVQQNASRLQVMVDNTMLHPSVKVVQSTRHSNANLESLFPREGIAVTVSDEEAVAEASIDHELVD